MVGSHFSGKSAFIKVLSTQWRLQSDRASLSKLEGIPAKRIESVDEVDRSDLVLEMPVELLKQFASSIILAKKIADCKTLESSSSNLVNEVFKMNHILLLQKVLDAESHKEMQELLPELLESFERLSHDGSLSRICGVLGIDYQPDFLAVVADAIHRISDHLYIPTDFDKFYFQWRTLGFINKRVFINGMPIDLFELGGMLSERKKWDSLLVQIAQEYSAIQMLLFTVAADSFAQSLLEDTNVNRMQDSMDLFDRALRIKASDQSVIILVLTKSDLLPHALKFHGSEFTSIFKVKLGEKETELAQETIASTFQGIAMKNNKKITRVVTSSIMDPDSIGNSLLHDFERLLC